VLAINSKLLSRNMSWNFDVDFLSSSDRGGHEDHDTITIQLSSGIPPRSIVLT
jgi:hypothetical protein